MKRETKTDVYGKEFTVLTPETEDDVQELISKEKRGELDTDLSFSDSPASLPLEEQN